MLNKSLIQFSVEGQDSVPSLLLDLRPNCARDNEDNGDLLQKVSCRLWYTQCPQPCSRPPPTHTYIGDAWTLTGKSGPFSCGITAPFSWVLVHTFLFLPSKSLFPHSCVSSGGSMVALMETSSKRAYAISGSAAPRVLAPVVGH